MSAAALSIGLSIVSGTALASDSSAARMTCRADGSTGGRLAISLTVPIGGRSFDAPDVRGAFELHGDLEKLPHRMRPLNPRDSRAQIAALGSLRQLERNPGIFRQVMLRGVPASIEIQSQRGCALLERLAQEVYSANDQWHGLRDSFAAPALGTCLVGFHVVHHNPRSYLRENSTLVRSGREVRRPGQKHENPKYKRLPALRIKRRTIAPPATRIATSSSLASSPRSWRRHRPSRSTHQGSVWPARHTAHSDRDRCTSDRHQSCRAGCRTSSFRLAGSA